MSFGEGLIWGGVWFFGVVILGTKLEDSSVPTIEKGRDRAASLLTAGLFVTAAEAIIMGVRLVIW